MYAAPLKDCDRDDYQSRLPLLIIAGYGKIYCDAVDFRRGFFCGPTSKESCRALPSVSSSKSISVRESVSITNS